MLLLGLVNILFDAHVLLHKYPVFYFDAHVHFSDEVITVTEMLTMIYTFSINYLFCWIALLAVLV